MKKKILWILSISNNKNDIHWNKKDQIIVIKMNRKKCTLKNVNLSLYEMNEWMMTMDDNLLVK